MNTKALAFTALSLVFSQTILASAWPPKNALCEKARVSELSINGIQVCELSETATSNEFKKALVDLIEINTKAADLFKIPLSKLFPKGIPVEITTSPSGINGHAKVGSNAIAVHSYPNPIRWLNRGVYAHELGHVLTFSNHPQIPRALKSMFRNHFSETIADTIAMAVVGEETSHETQLPLCFSPKRITYNQSYVTTVGFFDEYYYNHIMESCCQQFENLNSDTKEICQMRNQDEGGEPVYLPPYDMTPFDPMAKVPQSVEEHRIGIPINSFLLTLGHTVGKNLFNEFLNNTASSESKEFECQIKGAELPQQKVIGEVFPMQKMMFAIRSSLKAEDKIFYDVMWTELGMNAAIVYDDKNLASAAERNVRPEFIKAIKTHPQVFKGKKHCIQILQDMDESGLSDNTCEINCSIPL